MKVNEDTDIHDFHRRIARLEKALDTAIQGIEKSTQMTMNEKRLLVVELREIRGKGN